MNDSMKTRESRARRLAERQDLRLVKSRTRSTRAADFGAYWLVDPDRNTIVVGDQFGLSLDEVEHALGNDAA